MPDDTDIDALSPQERFVWMMTPANCGELSFHGMLSVQAAARRMGETLVSHGLRSELDRIIEDEI